MAIQLDKILTDIAKEKALHPNNSNATKQEQDEAWARIGKLNKLSVHESRSIFIVLQKKYDQEKAKGNSSWKLFNLMHQIHQEHIAQPKQEDEQGPMEEVEEYEMLEVQEPEGDDDSSGATGFLQPANSTGSASSDSESPSKSHGANSSPEKEERSYSKPNVDTPRPAYEEKKLLNIMAHNTSRGSSSSATTNTNNTTTVSAAAAVLQKKGITVKKTPNMSTPPSKPTLQQSNKPTPASRTTIQLPDSLKRKLSEEYVTTSPHKKSTKPTNSKHSAVASPSAAAAAAAESSSVGHTTTAQLLQVKKDREGNQSPPPGINIITIPAAPLVNGNNIGAATTSSTAATVASTSTNGFSPHVVDDIDFKNDIIFETGGNGHSSSAVAGSAPPEIINLGNFDNSLPPTFFKNLCNSSRYEALGLYVANVMNRVSRRAAAKLELGILRAIVDVQSDELEQ